ncbi:hypothetical protein [Streptomyces sp. GC420]|uniref:hypothetical protein n=1 Tax=Streptomyces sp. GC420 TaxID=2697568 RepID=UPI0014152451|nr:hypothetical protein [Streptomyces sp. GC420]NBM16274.1 hypothetical protein [Streptomyces sp. GC420]
MDDLMGHRVYGADHDDPGPRPGRTYRELVAGPLDGLLLDVTGWNERQLGESVALDTEIGAHGAGGRSVYRPRAGSTWYWDWSGDTP